MPAGRSIIESMRTLVRTATVCLAALLAAASARAASDNFQAPELKQTPPWLSIVLTLAFVAAAAAPAFKNAKRTPLQ